MPPPPRHSGRTLALLATIAGTPLLGAWLAGEPLREYFRFPPPLEIPRDYPRFSAFAAGAIGVLLAAIAISWWRAAGKSSVHPAGRPPARPGDRRFPAWGWLAVGWTLLWWALAWTRAPWFAWGQLYTFFPLWVGFIVIVNALVRARSGTCLMQRAPGRWFGLFAVSAAFWWAFEWLNRFVHNWHYLGVEEFGPAGYALNATLCFSTVLPAVAGVREWLGTFPRFVTRCADGPAWRWLGSRFTGGLLLAGGVAALLLTGAQPNLFYPALWLAPLALAWGTRLVAGEPAVPRQISRGDWSIAAPWALAALVCGFWWELWNWHSLAKWIYTVPYVDRWHVFEMPLLGYAGYLPFGLECLAAVERTVGGDDAIRGDDPPRRPHTPSTAHAVGGE